MRAEARAEQKAVKALGDAFGNTGVLHRSICAAST